MNRIQGHTAGGVLLRSSGGDISFALEIENVHKTFGGFRAVDGVSFTVRRGEFLSLLGPSGCGKTTLLRMIAGFERPTSGEIRIAGSRVNERPPYARPIGMVFQNLALFPHISVGENVAYGLRVRSVDKAEIVRRVDEALQLVGLQGFESRKIHELSGGQKQRVALARAIVIRPEVLLLDEPLSALDLKLRRQMQQELKQIQRRIGTTFIFVTHDQEEALAMSDRIAVMNNGKVEQLGEPQAIYASPMTPFVARFVGDTNFFEGSVASAFDGGLQVSIPELCREARLRTPYSLSAGERVGISVRPEHVSIAHETAGATALPGLVTECSYVGANTRYVVTLKEAPTIGELIVLTPNTQVGTQQFETGQDVYVGWSDDSMALVPLA